MRMSVRNVGPYKCGKFKVPIIVLNKSEEGTILGTIGGFMVVHILHLSINRCTPQRPLPHHDIVPGRLDSDDAVFHQRRQGRGRSRADLRGDQRETRMGMPFRR